MKRKHLYSFVLSGLLLLGGFTFLSSRADAAAANPSLYTVQKGDSLYRVAIRFGISVDVLKGANGLYSDMIYTGQTLHVPAVSGGPNIYLVQKGDSLYFIALKYGISIDSLKQNNNLSSNLITPGQVLVIPQKSLGEIVQAKAVAPSTLTIFVDKSDHTLTVLSDGIPLKTYHNELGDGGLDDKAVAGDHKTPEGNLYITEKLVLDPADEYLGTRWMRLSYPNIEDADRGLTQGLIDQQIRNEIINAINNKTTPPQRTALGGGVGIHGGTRLDLGKDWTYGCVGLTNQDVEEIYPLVSVGTPVKIQK
ncbi:LysM peptidoglycan-binding domain-containing protein [Heliobacterium chlorum]|uniref:LysM peptidoglycan-binding domain-containing protein n=1 Tax=Heliobacterium chlorum TaxID=2698 RepID=A0ABR7T035_HELCL|nr:L,D-transpeptidase [Heliobacterium chlorum]MBC9782931.1 LysM peptidoglycan-binding domain-containing protein [Heliobacterium chlorum]